MTCSHILWRIQSHIKQVIFSSHQAVTGTMDSEHGTPAGQGVQVLTGGLASVRSASPLGSAFYSVGCSWMRHLLLTKDIIFHFFIVS